MQKNNNIFENIEKLNNFVDEKAERKVFIINSVQKIFLNKNLSLKYLALLSTRNMKAISVCGFFHIGKSLILTVSLVINIKYETLKFI